MRRTERDMFVNRKFIPTQNRKRYEWYKRSKLINNWDADTPLVIRKKYGPFMVISPAADRVPELHVFYENSKYVIQGVE